MTCGVVAQTNIYRITFASRVKSIASLSLQRFDALGISNGPIVYPSRERSVWSERVGNRRQEAPNCQPLSQLRTRFKSTLPCTKTFEQILWQSIWHLLLFTVPKLVWKDSHMLFDKLLVSGYPRSLEIRIWNLNSTRLEGELGKKHVCVCVCLFVFGGGSKIRFQGASMKFLKALMG